MRLEPIEKPRNPLLKLAYWMSRRQLGAVISPPRVIYARSPRIAVLGYLMALPLRIESDELLARALARKGAGA